MTKVTLVKMEPWLRWRLLAKRFPMPNSPLASLGIEDATSLQVSVMALDGDTYPDMDDSVQKNLMHGWTILQLCSLDQGTGSIKVLRTLNSDIAQGHAGVPVDCFQPRHAVRIQTEDLVKEYLICFQCHNFQCWVDGLLVASGSISNQSENNLNRVLAECSRKNHKDS